MTRSKIRTYLGSFIFGLLGGLLAVTISYFVLRPNFEIRNNSPETDNVQNIKAQILLCTPQPMKCLPIGTRNLSLLQKKRVKLWYTFVQNITPNQI